MVALNLMALPYAPKNHPTLLILVSLHPETALKIPKLMLDTKQWASWYPTLTLEVFPDGH